LRLAAIGAVLFSGQAARPDHPQPAPSSQAGLELFEKRIRPLLHNVCFECHNKGDDSEGGLRLDTREHALAGGYRGPALVPGAPDQSLLMAAVRHEDEDLQMPPRRKLSHQEIDDLGRWIAAGAPWPDDPPAAIAQSSETLWSLAPLREPPLPQVNDSAWPTSPIDYFILAELEKNGLQPAPPADKATLLRRLSFDLIGLPPTPEELADFLADESPDAVAKVVDRLLASPHYGERWARHWMDLTRFAETNGYEFNTDKPNAWRYRDYCIDAFNSDVPYDRFLKEHVAGDLLEPRLSADGRLVMSPIGTAALWFQEMQDFVVDWPRAHAEEIENQLEVVGKAFLGLSLSCARCHDHKFDPIKTSDYYSLAGVLMSSTDVQACVDSPDRCHQTAILQSRLKEIVAAEQALLEKAKRGAEFSRRRLEEARRISDYLGAAREVLLADCASDAEMAPLFDAVAQRHNVDPARLRRWFAELTQAVQREDRVLRSWLRLARCSDDIFPYRKQAILARAEATNREIARLTIRPLFDFEHDGFQGWTVAGSAFGDGPDRSGPGGVFGYVGDGFANSRRFGDAFTGVLLSPRFKVDRPNLRLGFFIAGGKHEKTTCVNLIIHSQAMHQADVGGTSATGSNSHQFELRSISLYGMLNRECAVELVDEEQGEWGHIMADHFFLFEVPEGAAETGNCVDGWGDNDLVLDLLRDPELTTHRAFARAFQQSVIQTLTNWQAELRQQLAACDLDQREPEAIRFVRHNLGYDAYDELLAWALRDDSLLTDQSEAEKLLDAEDQQQLADLRSQRHAIEEQVEPASLALVAAEATPQNAQIQIRGDPHRLGVEVPRGYLSTVCGENRPTVVQGSGRLELAGWLASANNPLTPRVMVNRLWQHHFGRGLVATPDDFGARGEPPTHPQLLDYLASRFVAGGWSVKSLHRMMLLSSTYQQSSRSSQRADALDPHNRLLSHMPIRRLEAECIRDAMLAVSDDLDRTIYGPSVSLNPMVRDRFAYVPPSQSAAELAPRRTIYLEIRRGRTPQFLSLFDFPKPLSTVGSRAVSVIPLQSLNLMNDRFVVDRAKKWGAKIASGDRSPEDRICDVYLAAFSRRPGDAELGTALEFVRQQRDRHVAAGTKNPDEMAWVDFCHLTFNLGEFIFVR
jgi:hypothetical protein